MTSYHYNFLIITFLTFLFLKKKYLPSFLIWKSYKVILAALMHNLSQNNLSPQLFDFPFSKKKKFLHFFWKVTNCTHNFFDSLYIILQTTYHHTIFFMTILMPIFFLIFASFCQKLKFTPLMVVNPFFGPWVWRRKQRSPGNTAQRCGRIFFYLILFLNKIYVCLPGRHKVIFGPWGSAPGLMAPR